MSIISKGMKNLLIQVDDDLHKRLKIYAAQKGVTMAQLVRASIGAMTAETSTTGKSKTVHRRDGSSETLGG